MLRINATWMTLARGALRKHDVGGLGDDVVVVGADGGGVAAVDLGGLLRAILVGLVVDDRVAAGVGARNDGRGDHDRLVLIDLVGVGRRRLHRIVDQDLAEAPSDETVASEVVVCSGVASEVVVSSGGDSVVTTTVVSVVGAWC